ncbi:MAG TPA: hypothetical protein DEA08_14775 [Planctomycetes bacterium]|nr:hypothetical protein [Planctomycetota bacterium]
MFRWFDLRPGEGPRVAWVFALAFLLACGRVVLLSGANAALLSHYPAEAYGWVLVCAAALIFSGGVTYRASLGRRRFVHLASLVLLAQAAGTVGLQVLGDLSGRRELVLLLAAWVLLVWVFGLLILWTTAGRLLDQEQAGRLLALMGAGEVLGDVVGGAGVAPLLRVMPPSALPFVSATLLLFAVGVLRLIGGRFPEVESTPSPSAAAIPAGIPAGSGEQPAALAEPDPRWRPYVARLILLCGLITICYYLVDLGFFRQVRARYREAEAAVFLGRTYAVIASLTLGLRLFLAGRLLSRFGVRFATRVLPLAVLVTMAGVALASLSGSSELTFWLVVVSAVSWRVLKDGIDKPGLLLLYQALPPEPRLRTQSLVETMTDACATGLAGGLILTLSSAPWFGAAPIAGVTALLALVWVGLTRRLVRLHADFVDPR